MRNGDVIVAKITPCYENGKAAVCKNLPYEFAFGSTEFHVLRPSKDLVADYLYYLMHDPVVLSAGTIEMRGSAGQQRVPAEFIKNLRIPVPPVSEQMAIVKSLEQALDRFTRMTSCFRDEIKSLQEYQTKLISNVVTGKLDIKEAEKSLPQVLDDAAPDIETINPEDLEEERNEIETESEEVMM
jgi:restriction endonuclease S subunit